jgi:hypothetical protein
MEKDELQQKQASHAALASLLNLTIFPGISFIILLLIYKKTLPSSFDRYYAVLGIKTNIWAAIALFLVSGLMIIFGGFYSPWTWVYVLSYFMFVHSMFILFATWALTRCWAGARLSSTFLSK